MGPVSKEYQEQLNSWRSFDGERHARTDPNWPVRARFWGGLIPSLRGKVHSIIEVGGGNGDNLQAIAWYLGEPQPLMVNADVSPRVLSESRSRYPKIATEECLADSLPFKARSFDLSISCGLLLHVPSTELDPCLKELFRVAKQYVIIIEYFMPKETRMQWNTYGVPHWRRDYEPIVKRLGVPFDLKLNLPMETLNIFDDPKGDGTTNVGIQRGYFYERRKA